MVVMSPRPTLNSSGIDLPWGGTVYIQCDGIQKAVRVQIREEVVLENSPYQPGTVLLQALETKEGSATPFTPALPTTHLAPLVVKNKQLLFQDTSSGKESSLELVMENISATSVMWDLSSVAPAYIKVSSGSFVIQLLHSKMALVTLSLLGEKNLPENLTFFLKKNYMYY